MQTYSSEPAKAAVDSSSDPERTTRKPPTAFENAVLTIKILLIAAAIIGAIWAFEVFTA